MVGIQCSEFVAALHELFFSSFFITVDGADHLIYLFFSIELSSFIVVIIPRSPASSSVSSRRSCLSLLRGCHVLTGPLVLSHAVSHPAASYLVTSGRQRSRHFCERKKRRDRVSNPTTSSKLILRSEY